jgi:diphosphomevalonate decarboxylase
MQASEVIQQILQGKGKLNTHQHGLGFAPVNIALCKYWGKRNAELNLPVTSSLSIALPEKGAYTRASLIPQQVDQIVLNGELLATESNFAQRITKFLDYFRPAQFAFKIESYMNIPAAAGLASSACGFAALVIALNQLFEWQLDESPLSQLARIGSGSACRSLWPGFVLWQAGEREDGHDSFAQPLNHTWPELRIGLLICNSAEKQISSRLAMQQTTATSPFYAVWPTLINQHLTDIQEAILTKDFIQFGKISESNALAMHALMQTAWPSIVYHQPDTLTLMQQIWTLRAQGLPIFFTQDAGPNLKLLFLDKHIQDVQAAFPELDIVVPFAYSEDDMILVDVEDRAIGFAEKLQTHQQGLLHRAFSVFIFRENGQQKEVLLQQRATDKYHCGGLWTNTCCSHPRPGEHVMSAAVRRLQEEMGISTELFPKGVFKYRAEFANGLVEHEIDHVLVGYWQEDDIAINKKEVAAYRWISIDNLQADIQANPDHYTAWLAEALRLALI